MPEERCMHRDFCSFSFLWKLDHYIFARLFHLVMSEQCCRGGILVQYEEKLTKQISFSSLRIKLFLSSLFCWHFYCPHEVKLFSFLFLQLRKDPSSYQEEMSSVAQYLIKQKVYTWWKMWGLHTLSIDTTAWVGRDL